jgi:hypothetical protein
MEQQFHGRLQYEYFIVPKMIFVDLFFACYYMALTKVDCSD